MVTQYHIWHLQTKEYAEHMAIGDFYEGLNEKLDSIAEHFIGTGGNISVSEGQEFSNYSKSNVLGRLEEFGEFVNMVNNSLEGKNQLKVVLDEIEGCVSQTLYKLGLK
jgi:DNA-binding ferritin-like protein